MNNEAREKLKKFIANYGAAVCNTPRSCEMFLLTQLADYPDERKALVEALRQGAVPKLLAKDGGRSWDSLSLELAKELQVSASLSEDDAAWVIDSWGMALGKHPEAVAITKEPPPLPPPDRDPTIQADTMTKVTAFLPIVAAGGALGSAIGAGALGLVMFLMVSVVGDVAGRTKSEKIKSQAQTLEAGTALYVVLSTGICFAAGGVGAAVGWLVGKGSANPWAGFKACFWSGLIASAIAARLLVVFPFLAALPAALVTFGAALTAAHGIGRR